MRSLRKIALLLALAAWFLCACDQTIDVTINQDQTWWIESHLSYDREALKLLEKWLPQILEEVGPPYSLIPIDVKKGEEGTLKAGLETLVSYYAQEGILVEYERVEGSGEQGAYRIQARGRSFEQFARLLPDSIRQSAGETGGSYHFNILLGEAIVYARALYKLDIILHVGQVLSSNAPDAQGSSARWLNPREIDIQFVPMQPTPTPEPTPPPWWAGSDDKKTNTGLILGGVAGMLAVGAVVGWLVLRLVSRSSGSHSRSSRKGPHPRR